MRVAIALDGVVLDVEIDMCDSEGVCAEGLDEDSAYATAYRCCGWDDFD